MENQKLTAEELSKLDELEKGYEYISSTLGRLAIEEFVVGQNLERIKDEKANHLQTLSKLQSEEIELGKILTTKYGNGTINVETGEFIKS